MHVFLKQLFFSSSRVWKEDKIQQMSGRRYRAGDHPNMPDELFPHLPKSAKVITPPARKVDEGDIFNVEVDKTEVNELEEHDEARAAANAEAEAIGEADEAGESLGDKFRRELAEEEARKTKPRAKKSK